MWNGAEWVDCKKPRGRPPNGKVWNGTEWAEEKKKVIYGAVFVFRVIRHISHQMKHYIRPHQLRAPRCGMEPSGSMYRGRVEIARREGEVGTFVAVGDVNRKDAGLCNLARFRFLFS